MRAEMAGVAGFHPHRLRHTAAHRWLAKGGSEGGLMAVAGWTRPDMLLRYTKAQASRQGGRGSPTAEPGGAEPPAATVLGRDRPVAAVVEPAICEVTRCWS